MLTKENVKLLAQLDEKLYFKGKKDFRIFRNKLIKEIDANGEKSLPMILNLLDILFKKEYERANKNHYFNYFVPKKASEDNLSLRDLLLEQLKILEERYNENLTVSTKKFFFFNLKKEKEEVREVQESLLSNQQHFIKTALIHHQQYLFEQDKQIANDFLETKIFKKEGVKVVKSNHFIFLESLADIFSFHEKEERENLLKAILTKQLFEKAFDTKNWIDLYLSKDLKKDINENLNVFWQTMFLSFQKLIDENIVDKEIAKRIQNEILKKDVQEKLINLLFQTMPFALTYKSKLADRCDFIKFSLLSSQVKLKNNIEKQESRQAFSCLLALGEMFHCAFLKAQLRHIPNELTEFYQPLSLPTIQFLEKSAKEEKSLNEINLVINAIFKCASLFPTKLYHLLSIEEKEKLKCFTLAFENEKGELLERCKISLILDDLIYFCHELKLDGFFKEVNLFEGNLSQNMVEDIKTYREHIESVNALPTELFLFNVEEMDCENNLKRIVEQYMRIENVSLTERMARSLIEPSNTLGKNTFNFTFDFYDVEIEDLKTLFQTPTTIEALKEREILFFNAKSIANKKMQYFLQNVCFKYAFYLILTKNKYDFSHSKIKEIGEQLLAKNMLKEEASVFYQALLTPSFKNMLQSCALRKNTMWQDFSFEIAEAEEREFKFELESFMEELKRVKFKRNATFFKLYQYGIGFYLPFIISDFTPKRRTSPNGTTSVIRSPVKNFTILLNNKEIKEAVENVCEKWQVDEIYMNNSNLKLLNNYSEILLYQRILIEGYDKEEEMIQKLISSSSILKSVKNPLFETGVDKDTLILRGNVEDMIAIVTFMALASLITKAKSVEESNKPNNQQISFLLAIIVCNNNLRNIFGKMLKSIVGDACQYPETMNNIVENLEIVFEETKKPQNAWIFLEKKAFSSYLFELMFSISIQSYIDGFLSPYSLTKLSMNILQKDKF